MSLAVSDTSPINYLCRIGEIEILGRIFDQIILPMGVVMELEHPKAPLVVRDWICEPPNWVVQQICLTKIAEEGLGMGESETIGLALTRGVKAVLMDERLGRAIAGREGLMPIGTLALLEIASARGMLDLRAALGRLLKTNFRASPAVLDRLLRRREDS